MQCIQHNDICHMERHGARTQKLYHKGSELCINADLYEHGCFFEVYA